MFGGLSSDPVMNGRVLASSLLIGHFALANTAAQSSKRLAPSAYQGCYTLALSPWSPPLSGDVRYAATPDAIELTGIRMAGFKKAERFLVKPALGAKASVHSMSFWHLTPEGEVAITFTTGYVGLTMRLVRKGSVLVGTAITAGDDNPGEHIQTTGARADKVACRTES